MTYRNWTYIILIFISLPLIAVALCNYVIDPYSIFQSAILKKDYNFNERYNKIAHLQQHHEQYNSYIMGSSRCGTTSPSLIEGYIPGSLFYNLSVAGSTQFDNELMLKYLIQQKYDIKNIYLQIDISDLYGYVPSQHNYNAKHHPNVTHTPKIIYYLSYLTIMPVQHMYNKIQLNLDREVNNALRYDLKKSGRWYVDHLERKIHDDPILYVQTEPSFNVNQTQRGSKATKIKNNIDSLKTILELAKKHHINVVVFTAPHNHNMMNTFHLDSYLEYLEKIAALTPYWDFSGYNSVTNNNHLYYESSHYREKVAQMVAQRIFAGSNARDVPSDFGRWVDTYTIKAYLTAKNLEAQLHDQMMLASR